MLRLLTQPRQISKLAGCFLIIMITCGEAVLAQTRDLAYKGVDSFPLNIGDIAFNAALDDSTFIVCNPQLVFQYYNTGSYYKQHKREIEQYFKKHYQPTTHTARETGYVTIRFIINCSGKTGRFRMYELDANYQPYKFDPEISSQLLQLTKALTGWQPAAYNQKIYDSYQYITFKINKGAIECVLP
jgi:hypothetical protein